MKSHIEKFHMAKMLLSGVGLNLPAQHQNLLMSQRFL